MSPSSFNRKRQLSSPAPIGAYPSKALCEDNPSDGLFHPTSGNSTETGAPNATGITQNSLEYSATHRASTLSSSKERPVTLGATQYPVEFAVENGTDFPSDLLPFDSIRPQAGEVRIVLELDQTSDRSSLISVAVDEAKIGDNTPNASFSSSVVLGANKMDAGVEIVPYTRSIVTKKPLERVQVDVISFVTETSADYRFILHAKDHYSKFSMLWPLKRRSADEVTACMIQFMVYSGVPDIVQCGNGDEFKGAFLILLKENRIKLCNDHYKAPGLVKQGNGTVRARLHSWKDQTGRTDWHKGLPYIYNAMNRTSCRGLPRSITPAEVFFGAISVLPISQSYPKYLFEDFAAAARSMGAEDTTKAGEKMSGLDFCRVIQAINARPSRTFPEN